MKNFVLLVCILMESVAFAKSNARHFGLNSLSTNLPLNSIQERNHLKWNDIKVSEGLTEKVTEWESLAQVTEAFELIKNHRFIQLEDGQLRRLNWLEPDDGLCFYRAGISSGLLKDKGFPLTASVYLGGGMVSCSAWKDGDSALRGGHSRANPAGDTADCVGFNWHNAPAARVNGVVYVLDPALNFERPLSLREWVEIQYESNRSGNNFLQLGIPNYNSGEAGPSYGLEGENWKKIFASFYSEYLENSPFKMEESKVYRFHSKRLLTDNPPWLGMNSKDWDFAHLGTDLAVETNCVLNGDKFEVSLTGRLLTATENDHEKMLRLHLNSSLLEQFSSGPLVMSNLSGEVIHFNVGRSLEIDNFSRAVLGSGFELKSSQPVSRFTNCDDAQTSMRGLMDAVQIQSLMGSY